VQVRKFVTVQLQLLEVLYLKLKFMKLFLYCLMFSRTRIADRRLAQIDGFVVYFIYPCFLLLNCFLVSIIIFDRALHRVLKLSLAILQLITRLLVHQLELVECIEVMNILVAQFIKITAKCFELAV
jgi:hypothetical protein